MSMIIDTPDRIEEPLLQTCLIVDVGDRLDKSSAKVMEKDELNSLKLPDVTIGKAECWNLSNLAVSGRISLPTEMSAKLENTTFCLVRFACSFRTSGKHRITWARFTVSMKSQYDESRPIAYDIYPREVLEEVKGDLEVNISPSLKFASAEVKIGEVVATITRSKVVPTVIGTGVQEADVYWDMEEYGKTEVMGSKFFYIIMECPKNTPSVEISMNLIAEVKYDKWLLPARISGLKNSLDQQIII